MTIPSRDIEQPTENSDADDAVEYALAGRYAEPLARHASHNSGAGTATTRPNVPQATLTAYHGVVASATLDAGPRTNQNTVKYTAKNSK